MASIISEPSVTLNIIPAVQTAENTEQKVLFIGQMKTGSATSGTLVQNIGVLGEEDALFGSNSFLAGMIREARKLNQITIFDAIPLADNGAGVAASGTIVFSGTATGSGTINVTIGSYVNYTFAVPVVSGDTPTVIGAALAALVNANTDIPVSAVNTTGSVALTCDHKGTIGNKIGIGVSGSAASVTYAITGFASGATDPSLTSVFTPVTDLRYQTVVWPTTYSKTTVVNFLDGRFNITNNVLDGVAITSVTDTTANLLTALAALNSKSLMFNCNSFVNSSTALIGPALLEFDDVIASQFAALRSLRLTDGADLSAIVTGAQGSLDTFGGMSLASLPYANTPFVNLPQIAPQYGFLQSEIAQLNAAGGSTIGDNKAGNTTIAGRILTTYKTDSAGNADTSFQFLNYVDTISVVREFFYNNLKERFAKTRLTSGDLIAGRTICNSQSISSYFDSLYNDLINLALVQGGATAIAFYKANKTVSLTLSTGTATILMLVPIVVQLRTIIATLQLSFENFGG